MKRNFCPVLNLSTDDRAERSENKMGVKNSLDTVFSLKTSKIRSWYFETSIFINILQTPTLHAGWLISKLIEFYWFAAICMECTRLVWRNVIITLKPRKWQERLKFKCIPHLSNLRNDNLIQSRFENINAPVENYVNISFSWFAVNQLLFLPTFLSLFCNQVIISSSQLEIKKI